MAICKYPGCQKEIKIKGYCLRHYNSEIWKTYKIGSCLNPNFNLNCKKVDHLRGDLCKPCYSQIHNQKHRKRNKKVIISDDSGNVFEERVKFMESKIEDLEDKARFKEPLFKGPRKRLCLTSLT